MKATLASIAAATLILLTLVLPAEFGIDPLGTGEMLGLTGLSESGPSAVVPEEGEFRIDRVRFELSPFESVEYKYRLAAGAGVVYSWVASGEAIYDFHAEPDGAEAGYAESFQQGRGTVSHGTYSARFPGIHGWFWENRGTEPLVVDLVTSGFYSEAIEFRDGDQSSRQPQGARERLDGRP